MLVGAARERSFVWRCFIMVGRGGGLTQLTRNLAACRTRDAVRSSPATRRAGRNVVPFPELARRISWTSKLQRGVHGLFILQAETTSLKRTRSYIR